jgi:putative acetyltransferase
MIKLIRTKSDHADFRNLVAMLDADLLSRYGPLQAHYDQFNSTAGIDTVVVAYVDNDPAGCGCFKRFDSTSVEIKRMFVKKELRGNGIADAILKELEQWAGELGYEATVLETAIKQPEAIAFYRRMGYHLIPNYGQYAGNDNSLCMRKTVP